MNSTASNHVNASLTTDGMVSEKTDNTVAMMSVAKIMHWYSSAVFGTVFLVIGMIGNVLSIVVWNRKSLRSSAGIYLIAQAATDISVLVSFFVTDSLPMMIPDIKKQYAYGVFYSYIGYPLFFLSFITSVWVLVGVTVDRYIQVCWITHSISMCNQKRALNGIGIISLLCFIVNVPHFFTYQPVSIRNQTDDAYELTEYGTGSGSQMYEFWVHCIFLVLVPWFAILFMNVMIIRYVLKKGAKLIGKKNVSAQQKTKRAENQLTTILLTVTFTFLFLIAIQCIVQCFFMLKPEAVNFELVDEAFA